jgi:hypothetical protein
VPDILRRSLPIGKKRIAADLRSDQGWKFALRGQAHQHACCVQEKASQYITHNNKSFLLRFKPLKSTIASH